MKRKPQPNQSLQNKRVLRITGIIAIISFMFIILVTWIGTEASGHTYFSAGESNPVILYIEWILGLLGLAVAIGYLKKEYKLLNL